MKPEFNKKSSNLPHSGGKEDTTTESLLLTGKIYRSIFNEAPIGISNINAAGRIVNVNYTFAEILGCTREEMFGRQMFEITRRYFKKSGGTVWSDSVCGQISIYKYTGRR